MVETCTRCGTTHGRGNACPKCGKKKVQTVADKIDGMIDQLREAGYAVIIYSPEELKGADPRRVESAIIDQSWDIVKTLYPEPTLAAQWVDKQKLMQPSNS